MFSAYSRSPAVLKTPADVSKIKLRIISYVCFYDCEIVSTVNSFTLRPIVIGWQ